MSNHLALVCKVMGLVIHHLIHSYKRNKKDYNVNKDEESLSPIGHIKKHDYPHLMGVDDLTSPATPLLGVLPVNLDPSSGRVRTNLVENDECSHRVVDPLVRCH